MNDPNPHTADAAWPPADYSPDSDTVAILNSTPLAEEGANDE